MTDLIGVDVPSLPKGESPTFWQWYLLERRLKLTFILAFHPFAKPILDWMVKPRG